uniref:MT domain-containing protein n=1 Tax=Steinernema glaseri TaxID=37863 RepID=A0A1I7YQ21_9BILA
PPIQSSVAKLTERTASLKHQLIEAEVQYNLTKQELTNLKSGYETAKNVTAKQLVKEKADIKRSEDAAAAQRTVEQIKKELKKAEKELEMAQLNLAVQQFGPHSPVQRVRRQ